jgi:prolyl-tRNA editing enzyme YbaK/EbsC (Cys-tRNA(Pro) deacylase)
MNSQLYIPISHYNAGMVQSIVFPNSTRTAAEAAARLGCAVAQIAKSIVFKTDSGKPVLVIVSGINRVDEYKLAQLVNEKVSKADADFVRVQTGHVIGGVPPFGFPQKITTYIDQDLSKYDRIWASAGTVNSVFATSFSELKEKSQAITF